MASEPGGRSDKLGNEFEKLWTARHLIELLSGRATSVRIECLGDDERGTEFWVGRPDGKREAHQCKRENASAGLWTVADLEGKRILTNAHFQLNREPSHHFVFTSGDKVPHLSDLSERARMCDDPVEFRDLSVTTSKKHEQEFQNLCRYLALDPSQDLDLAKVVDFLRRFRPWIADKNYLRVDVEDMAARWLTGEPTDAIAALKDLIDKSIGVTLRLEDVVAALPAGVRPRDLAQDPTLHTALQSLRDRFDRSYRHMLIGGVVLGRRETHELSSLLGAEDGPRLILLHGPGGEGKSGVVFEVVERLKAEGHPYLPLRLDRDRPEDTPIQYGRKLDLPTSPTACLAASADGRPAVLLLDQVDAIRWTAAHSANAWDTCERLISEALSQKNLRVVVVCRSFDVEDHPQIRAWKNSSKVTELKVAPLDDATVNANVAACGVALETLDSRQREVLRSPQGLYLWKVLHESDKRSPVFRSLTHLMRLFWEMTREKLRELRPGQYEEVLETLVRYMDRRGCVDAPRTIVSRWPSEVDALISLNALVEGDRNNLLFAHQSYLDHLTAEKLLKEIHAGSGTVLGWLESDDQSLFRRGQMRQVLALLRDEDSRAYLETVQSLLGSDKVRFHLKHLVLQTLGHVDQPFDGEVDLVLSLLGDKKWTDHVFGQVLAGREAWFDALHSRNVIRDWLDNEDESRVNLALSLIDRVVESHGEPVEKLTLDVRKEGWQRKLETVLWRHSPEKLSPGLFNAYLRLTRRGSTALRDFIDWKALARSNPQRCIDLLDARLAQEMRKLRVSADGAARGRREREDLRGAAISEIASAAATMPIVAWDRLARRLLQVLAGISRTRRATRTGGYDSAPYETEQRLRHLATSLLVVLTSAGKAMAATATGVDALWDRTAKNSRYRSKPTYRLIVRCLSAGPDDWADRVIRWLLADDLRLRCGRGEWGAAYEPTWRLLRRFSRVCSDDILTNLLSAILAHRPEWEKEWFINRHATLLGHLKHSKYFGYDILSDNKLGQGQYILLSAIPKSRLSPAAADWRGVLKRKFGPVKPLLQRPPRSMSGWVSSTIPRDRLRYLSDRDWLRIIDGRWQRRGNRWKRMGPDHLGEANVETFSADFGKMTNLQPQRFARLAVRIPKDANRLYPTRILWSLSSTEPPEGKEDSEDWRPADVEEIEPVFEHFGHLGDDRDFATALCWCIQKRGDGNWSHKTLRRLVEIATTNPHPTSGEYSVFREKPGSRAEEDESVPVLLSTSINCVRGSAAKAIQSVLFGHREWLDFFRPAIALLINDPHPAVRLAAIGLALPLLNIDRSEAVTTFLTACSQKDDRVLTSPDVNNFFRYTILNYVDDFEPLIKRMVESPIEEVAKSGGEWVGVVWAHRGLWQERLDHCMKGTTSLREGVANALVFAVTAECDNKNASAQLVTLFGDPNESVRAAAASFFRCNGALELALAASLAESFVASPALDENSEELLFGIEQHNGSLRPFAPALLSVVARFSGPLAHEARDISTALPLHADLLAKVLLRLYEQSEGDQNMRRKCLDAWDRLLSERIGFDLLRHIDA